MKAAPALATGLVLLAATHAAAAPTRPNVLVVITDDQGFGDLGASGNPVIRTPNLDAFAKQSVSLKNFYVCPVCSPTRSGLLTGRYNYRTGVVDTFIGRSMMRPEEVTLAETLSAAGYRTGLFGKWHLGDHHPMRPEDQGFGETLWHHGGGLSQPSDPPDVNPATAYFDPHLTKNGKPVVAKGYCTDVFTDAAVAFMTADKSKPFFAYVAYNAPHGPFQVPAELAAPYRKLDLTAAGFPKIGQPWATPKLNTDEIARAYGMIENIDTNFARMLNALDTAGVANDTVVVFLTDNGPGGVRFNAGLRNRKGTVYEGGIRVPCFVRWPKRFPATHVVTAPAAHIDMVPTLLAACGVTRPADAPPLDGLNLLTALTGKPVEWNPDRTLFTQWHRGDVPERYRAFAARGPRYKLVQAAGVQQDAKWKPKFELFDITNDPFEEKDLAADRPEEVAKLKAAYDAWFTDVTKAGFDPPRISIGSEKENPVRLTRQDWRGPKAGWTPDSEGAWAVKVERAGKYKLTAYSNREFVNFEARVGDRAAGGGPAGPKKQASTEVELTAGPASAWAKVGAAGVWRAADYLELEYVGGK